MKKITTSGFFLMALIIFASFTACHSSSSSEPAATRAVITLATSATGSTPLIYGVQATVNLPAGVTVKASSSSGTAMDTDTGVVVASGQAAGAELVHASYVASSATLTMGKVEVFVAKSSGFSSGEFALVTCDIAAGSSPGATDFTVTDFKAVDQNGATIAGLTAGFTASMQ